MVRLPGIETLGAPPVRVVFPDHPGFFAEFILSDVPTMTASDPNPSGSAAEGPKNDISRTPEMETLPRWRKSLTVAHACSIIL